MTKSSSARRVPRQIGQDEDEPSLASAEREGVPEPTLKRPTFKPRKGTTLRKSFGLTAVEDDEEDAAGVVTPKRQGLSRIASQRNAAKKSSLLPSNFTTREDDDDDRPSYSAASLQELKNSTPSTPLDVTTDASALEVEDVERSTQALDLSSKFGNSLSRYNQPSAIPSAAEIEEKKERRARLAKEQAADEFISLDPDDPQLDGDDDEDENVTRDESGRLILKPKDKYGQAESRLVRDDEDVLENFDEFTEADGKILLGRKAEAEAARKRKQDMAAQIANAEGSGSDSDSNASEKERNEAFEAAQTKHGTYAENTTSTDPYANMRPRTPPIISPLPTLEGALERLRAQVVELQTERMRRMKEMDALQTEKVRLGGEEVRIQRQLKETGEWYAKLRAEKGIEGGNEEGKGEHKMPEEGGQMEQKESGDDAATAGAGLGFAGGGGNDADAGFGFGAAGAGLGFGAPAPDADSEDDDADGARPGLGMGAGIGARGLESLGASTTATPEAEMEG